MQPLKNEKVMIMSSTFIFRVIMVSSHLKLYTIIRIRHLCDNELTIITKSSLSGPCVEFKVLDSKARNKYKCRFLPLSNSITKADILIPVHAKG